MAFSGLQITRLHVFGWPTRRTGSFAGKVTVIPFVDLDRQIVHIWNLGPTERPVVCDVVQFDTLIGIKHGNTYLLRAGNNSMRRKTQRLHETARRRVTLDG